MSNTLLQGQSWALFTALCYALNSLGFQRIGKFTPINGATHMRMWIALPIVLLMTYISQGFLIPATLSTQAILLLLISGFFGYFLTDLLLFQSYMYLGPRESLVLLTISPVLVAIFGFFLFDEALNIIQTLGILITVGGILIMVIFGGKTVGLESSKKRFGYILATSAAIIQTVANLLARSAVLEAGANTTNLLRNVGGLVAFIIYFGVIKRQIKTQAKPFLTNRNLLFLLIFATLAGPVLGTFGQMKAYTLAPVGIVSTITQDSPIMLLPVDYFFFNRQVSKASFMGTILSVLGIGLLFLAI